MLAVGEPLDDFKQEEASEFALKNTSLVVEWKMNLLCLLKSCMNVQNEKT